MKKMKKILIALDYDPSAQMVADYGFAIAKAMGAEAILLHIVKDPALYSSNEQATILGFAGNLYTVPVRFDNVTELKKIAMHFLEKAKRPHNDASIICLVKEGPTAETILVTAKEEHADIIVLGAHTQTWLENKILGSVMDNVLHHSAIPLFVIPTQQKN